MFLKCEIQNFYLNYFILCILLYIILFCSLQSTHYDSIKSHYLLLMFGELYQNTNALCEQNAELL
jgi:hypothetical protein